MIRQLGRFILVSLAALTFMTLSGPGKAYAQGLQIRPLMYRETLRPTEARKGYVDVSNPDSVPADIHMQVRGFRQTDSHGNLRFYDSPILSRGIRLDLTDFQLGPREAARVYFQAEGNKLPKGDVFAAIFAATQSAAAGGITPNAQIGTLLILENGQAGPRQVTVQALHVPRLQFDSSINGAVTIKNPAPPEPASGFFPKVDISLTPIAGLHQQVQGPLVMSGVSRTVDFSLPASRIGIYRLAASVGDSHAQRTVLVVTGYWRLLVTLLLVVLAAGWILIKRRLWRNTSKT